MAYLGDRRVFIKADLDLPFRQVDDLLQVCREGGADEASVVTREDKSRPGGRLNGRRRPRGRAKSEINVTPLIDIVLVLLIVFIVLVPGLTKALPVARAPGGADQRPAAPRIPATRRWW